MPVTWMSQPLSYSVQFTLLEVVEMINKLSPADQVSAVIEIMCTLDEKYLEQIAAWIEGE